MSLTSLLIKGGSKAFGYGKRIVKVTPDFLLGETSDVIGLAMKNTKGSLFTKGKAGFRALEQHVATESKNGSFFTRVVKNLKSTPGAMKNGYKTAAATAKAAGKNGIFAGIKGAVEALLKKMPLIGTVLTVAFEAPNIYRAFRDGGFKAGMKEFGGAGVELGCMAGGAAIGSAICPGIGTAVGAVVGGIIGMFARGKTHSEKKAEEEAAQQPQPTKYTNDEKEALKAYGLTDDEIKQLQDAGYTIQDVEQAIIKEMEAQGIYVPQPAQTIPSLSDRLNTSYTEQINYPKTLNGTPKQTTAIVAEDPIEYETTQLYDPTQSYQYNNIDTTIQTGFNNPYATLQNPYNTAYMNTNAGCKYANDIYFQQIFGPQNSLNNPFIQNSYPQN